MSAGAQALGECRVAGHISGMHMYARHQVIASRTEQHLESVDLETHDRLSGPSVTARDHAEQQLCVH